MCTLALYFHVFENYPLVIAANRDEHYDRPSAAPQILSVEPRIIAGKDLRVGGTWLGINEHGVFAAILNRRANGEQSAVSQARSRGLLCLDVLKRQSAREASSFLRQCQQDFYQPFTLVFADRKEAWVSFNEDPIIHTMRLAEGLHVFSSTATHNEYSEKKERAYALFSGLTPQLNSKSVDVSSWTSIVATVLSDHSAATNSNDPRDAICVHTDISGTVSSSIVIYSSSENRFRTLFCAGAPCRNAFSESLSLNVE